MVTVAAPAGHATSRQTRLRVVVLICANVLGGHEFQAAALVRALARHADVTVLTNLASQRAMFEAPGVVVRALEQQLLRAGPLPRQLLDGLRRRRSLRAAVAGNDHAIVSGGAVEAGVAAALALHGFIPTSLYLPFFYDRIPAWGPVAGTAYNALLAACCRLFQRIVTINRIQARLIRAFTGVPTMVVDNEIRSVAAPVDTGTGRLVFVGRLGEQKRVGELLDWVDFPGNPFDELILIGDGPLRQALEAQGRSLAHMRCTFHGWLGATEQDRLLRPNDVLLINSLLEGEPLSIREAQARGMRVLARDIVGVRGVTRRGMRYRDAGGLRALLSCMQTDRAAERPTPRSAADGRRQRQVARLAEALERS
jgi:glycosyltransferase involved in cell wall biosynthesis